MDVTAGFNPYFDLMKDPNNAKSLITPTKVDSVIELISNEFKSEISLQINNTEPFLEYDGFLFWVLPVYKDGVGHWRLERLLADRKSTLKLKSIVDESYDFTIELPENYEMITPEIGIKEENSVGSVEIQISQKKNKIRVKKVINIKKDIIQSNEYDEFRLLLNTWNTKSYKELVFRK